MAQANTNTSPSPPPSIPTALTPGPRATAFTQLYNSALSSTLKSLPYTSFAACFPTIANSAPDALKGMHKNLVSTLEKFAREEFESILVERRVVERLNGLEDVIREGRRRKERDGMVGGGGEVVVPHTLPPPILLKTYLNPLHTSQQSLLNAKLQTTASQNASLAAAIDAQRKEIEDLLRLAEGLVKDLQKSGEMVRAVVDGEEGLSRKAREGENVLGEF